MSGKYDPWQVGKSAQANSGDHEPIVFIKKNGKKPLAVVDAEHFINGRTT